MKKLILSLTIAACAALTVQAQEEKKPEGGGARAEGREGRRGGQMTPEERLKRLTETLTLNQEQQDKIKKIMEDGRSQFEGLRDLPQDQRREKMREAFKAQNDKIVEVLNAEQKEKYKEMMARRPEGGGQRRGGGTEAEKKPEAKPEEKK